MANLQKRGDYTPRSQREKQAYRMVQIGGASGVAGVVTLVLAIAGVVGAEIPIILLLIAVFCAWRFTRVTGQR
jgi:hypothetical protein